VCRAVFEIPTTATAVVVVPAAAAVEKGRGKKVKGKQTATTTATAIFASSLPVNHFASTMLATSSSSSSVSKRFANPNHVVCEGCEENEASEYCKECSMAFCVNCKKIHLKPKVTAHHQFILLEEAMKPGGTGGGDNALRITRCEKHPHQEINTYCHTDKLVICPECVVDFHKEHKIDRLVIVVQGFRDEISQLVDKVCFFFFFFLLFFFPKF